MPDREYTKYQKKIISRFYDNRDQQDEQRLAELVASLYLTEGKKLAKLWTTAGEIMERLRVPTKRHQHILQTQNPAILAELVQEIQNGQFRPAPEPTPPADSPPS